MKVVFLTHVTPYKENIGGPSGHPYHLLLDRPKDVDVLIYSLNSNKLTESQIADVESKLHLKIKCITAKGCTDWILNYHLGFLRLFLKYPINYYRRLKQDIVDEIKALHPDVIWGYSQEFSGVLKQFRDFKRVHSLPDCYTLHWYRQLGTRYSLSNWKEYLRTIINYRKFYRMERDYDEGEKITYHLVGEKDCEFLKKIHPHLNVNFVRHPHYELADPQKEIHFSQPKIKLLFAGRYDFYCKETTDELIEYLIADVDALSKNYEITFLGKGWEQVVKNLQHVGYDAKHIAFAPNYIEEVIKHDIQINAITIGTGTKGKVLDALANGLLVVGTMLALENIAVEDEKSCIIADDAKQMIDVLKLIPQDVAKYETIAECGRTCVLKYHNLSTVSKNFFDLFK